MNVCEDFLIGPWFESTPYHPQLFFNGTVVAKVNEQKHLGLILDSGIAFGKHLNEKIMNAKKNLGIIKYHSNLLPLKTLDQMYKPLVRPHFDYCDIIYHIPSKQDQFCGILNSLMEKAERIQYQAAQRSGSNPGCGGKKFHNVYDYTIVRHPFQVSENHKPRVHPSHVREIGQSVRYLKKHKIEL